MGITSYGRRIDWLAAQKPSAPSITYEGRTVSRLEFSQRTNRMARAYEKLGVRQDDFVTIALPNGIEFFEAVFAVWKLGATPQPVSEKIPKIELEAIVDLASNEPALQSLPREIVYCRIPIVDAAGNPPGLLLLAVDTVAGLLKRNIPTLVYCSAGLSRTPAVAAAAIAIVRNCSLSEAMKLVARNIPADVSPGLFNDLQAIVNSETNAGQSHKAKS